MFDPFSDFISKNDNLLMCLHRCPSAIFHQKHFIDQCHRKGHFRSIISKKDRTFWYSQSLVGHAVAESSSSKQPLLNNIIPCTIGQAILNTF